MEVALGDGFKRIQCTLLSAVLILVLVEVALGELFFKKYGTNFTSLNPCFSGSCSWSNSGRDYMSQKKGGLNPCFSGSCSWRLFN